MCGMYEYHKGSQSHCVGKEEISESAISVAGKMDELLDSFMTHLFLAIRHLVLPIHLLDVRSLALLLIVILSLQKAKKSLVPQGILSTPLNIL